MKELTIELNQDYKQFKNGFNQKLKGDLIIISGVNGSGKTQLMDILNRSEVNEFLNSKIAISSKVLINKDVLDAEDVFRRSFKEIIRIENIKLPEPKNVLWHKEQAWKYYKGEHQWINGKTYNKSIKIMNTSLKNIYEANNTRGIITKEEFIKLLPDNFVWEEDDLFSNKIAEIFYEFASKRQDKKAELGMLNGGFNNKEYIKDAPWTILNEIFENLRFNYRFKEDYEFVTPNLSETPSLLSINSYGELDPTSSIKVSSLSDGEKSIISLTFALLNEKRRPIEKLLLLDEFDNTLNPSLIESLFKVLEEYFIKKGVMVVMTTHSPVTISLAPDYATFYELFRQDDESPKILQVQKEEYTELKMVNKKFYDKMLDQKERIKKLEEKIEEKNKIIESDKRVFVEDEYTQIYKLAWLKLNDYQPTEQNLESLFDLNSKFKIFSKGNKDSLKGYLCNQCMDECEGKKIIGLFDFDDAYNCFSELKVKNKNDWTETLGEENSGLYKNRKDYKNIYAMMLPVPEHRKQIASIQYSTKRLEVELLFTDEDIEDMFGNDSCAKETVIGDIKIPKISNKKNFWVKAINMPKESFEYFKPLFKRIYELLEIK